MTAVNVLKHTKKNRQCVQYSMTNGNKKAAIMAHSHIVGYAHIKYFEWRDVIDEYSDYFIRY